MDSIYKQIVMSIIKSAEILESCFRFRSSSSFVESARELGKGGVLDGDVVVVPVINQAMKIFSNHPISDMINVHLNMAALCPEEEAPLLE